MSKKRSKKQPSSQGAPPEIGARAQTLPAASRQKNIAPEENLRIGRRLVWLIPLLAIAVYANTWTAGFTLDDLPLIRDNPLIRSLDNVPRIFATHYWAGKDNPTDRGLYRPATLTTYALNYAVHQLRPAGYHLVNVLLHALVSWLLYLLVVELFRDRRAALIAGLLFAVHTIHTEAVAGIVGRAEMLSLSGMLGCVVCYFRSLRFPGGAGLGWTALTLVSFALAVFSKELGVLTPAIILMSECLLPDRRHLLRGRGSAIRTWMGFAAILTLFFILRAQATSTTGVHESWHNVSSAQRIWTALRVCMEYVGLLLAPLNLSADYWTTEVPLAAGPQDPAVLAAIALMAAALGALIWFWRRQPVFSWAIAFFGMTLFPVSNLPFAMGVLKAERLLYTPSAGFLIGVAALASWLLVRPQIRSLVWPVVIAAIATLSVLTWNRNKDWRDNPTLAAATLKTSPDSPRFNVIMGQWYSSQNRDGEAEQSLLRALRANPYELAALNNLGLVYYHQGRLPEAVTTLKRALEIDPEQYETYANLMSVYRDLKQYDESLTLAQEALRRFPDKAAIHWNTANLYYLMGRREEARVEWKRALELDPHVGVLPPDLAAELQL